MKRLEIENYNGELNLLREKVCIYELLFHQFQLHSQVTMNSVEIGKIVDVINFWSYSHRMGNGKLDNHKLVREAFGAMKKLVLAEPELPCNAAKNEFEDISQLKGMLKQEEAGRIEAEKKLKEYREFIRDIRDNYDCDSNAHKYGTPCRACDAAKLYPKNELHF